MLEVIVKVWPKGNEKYKKTIGRAVIANDRTGTEEIGNYEAVFESDGKTLRSRLANFPRNGRAWSLICLALQEAIVNEMDAAKQKLDDERMNYLLDGTAKAILEADEPSNPPGPASIDGLLLSPNEAQLATKRDGKRLEIDSTGVRVYDEYGCLTRTMLELHGPVEIEKGGSDGSDLQVQASGNEA